MNDAASLLGPGGISSPGSPFLLTPEDWNGLAKATAAVAPMRDDAISDLSPALPSIRDLREECRRWSGSTAPELTTLARRIRAYAAELVPKAYHDLEDAIGSSDPRRYRDLDEILGAECRAIADRSKDVFDTVRSLDIQLASVSIELDQAGGEEGLLLSILSRNVAGGAGTPDDQVGERLEAAIARFADVLSDARFATARLISGRLTAAVAKMQADWGLTRADVASVAETLRTHASASTPFIDALAIRTALDRWAEVVNLIDGFLAHKADGVSD